VSGVRSPNLVELSTSATVIVRTPNRKMAGKVHGEQVATDVDACERLCSREKQCVSFSFIASRKQCNLYSSADGYTVQEGFESGIKRQPTRQ
jgi:hypothetical protein